MAKLGMIRVAAASPEIRIANPDYNGKEIIRCIEEARSSGAGLVVFPALCLTGATCGDLFYQDNLYDSQLNNLYEVIAATDGITCAAVIGIYLKVFNSLVECGALIQNGKLKGIVPRYCPSLQNRYFSFNAIESGTVQLFGEAIPFGKMIFTDVNNGITLAVEVGDDIFTPLPPGDELVAAGAQIVLNPAASKELIGSSDTRLKTVLQKGRTRLCGHVYSSAGALESSSAGTYSGHCIISEKDKLLKEDSHLSFSTKIIVSDIDFQSLVNERIKNQNFNCSLSCRRFEVFKVGLDELPVLDSNDSLMRSYSKTPFVSEKINSNCQEAFSIQTTSLARRILHVGCNKVVLGVSGGLDSTVALFATAGAMKLLNKPAKDIITVTMPGFGTSGKTYSSGMAMMEALGSDIREIPIKNAVLLHFKDIGHDPANKNTVYENVQARERTQILMNIANMEGGMQIGTGDLSEIALGWSTFNGDHMSMYNVNAGLPKTFLQAMIRWFMDCLLADPDRPFSLNDAKLNAALKEVLDTPVSPELLPTDDKDEITQRTEDKIGPYILHDFFLYHTIKHGISPIKLLTIAKQAFSNEYDEDFIIKWLKTFYIRFFAHQFKRGCAPDSPQVGSVSLSPKGDWSMPSDGDVKAWLKELETTKEG